MELPKLYIGPMTKSIIDAVILVSNELKLPIGLIPSRRQIDSNSGYVWNTREFMEYLKFNKLSEFIVVERDHAGLGQGEISNEPTYSNVSSMQIDVEHNMNMIHIDPWKKYKDYELGLRETINNILYIISISDNINFEIGTEEAIRPFSIEEFHKFLKDLKYEIGPVIFNRIKYAVIQSGTAIRGTKNTGKFNLEKLIQMNAITKEFGLLSKEHNGDYLSDEDLMIRFKNGLDAINIAPEFGVYETQLLLEHITDEQLNKVYDICLNGKKWVKWVDSDFDIKNKTELIKICGHYHNTQIKSMVNYDNVYIMSNLKNKIKNIIKLIYE